MKQDSKKHRQSPLLKNAVTRIIWNDCIAIFNIDRGTQGKFFVVELYVTTL